VEVRCGSHDYCLSPTTITHSVLLRDGKPIDEVNGYPCTAHQHGGVMMLAGQVIAHPSKLPRLEESHIWAAPRTHAYQGPGSNSWSGVTLAVGGSLCQS
jgi:hypothetical protein